MWAHLVEKRLAPVVRHLEAEAAGHADVMTAFDKAFSDAMVKLSKGTFTEAPVQSRFGFHVIQLEDVRQTRFPALAEVKPRIQQQLVQQKKNEAMTNWVNGLTKDFCKGSKVKYQPDYTPSPDPCAQYSKTSSNQTTTG